MNASMSYLNGGDTLLSGAKTPDEKQAEKERQAEPASRPGGFRNDPDDPSNPNEVRERHLKKVDQKLRK
jgi:hypothetical protein